MRTLIPQLLAAAVTTLTLVSPSTAQTIAKTQGTIATRAGTQIAY